VQRLYMFLLIYLFNLNIDLDIGLLTCDGIPNTSVELTG
jgi:hypothetical protein